MHADLYVNLLDVPIQHANSIVFFLFLLPPLTPFWRHVRNVECVFFPPYLLA